MRHLYVNPAGVVKSGDGSFGQEQQFVAAKNKSLFREVFPAVAVMFGIPLAIYLIDRQNQERRGY